MTETGELEASAIGGVTTMDKDLIEDMDEKGGAIYDINNCVVAC